ncbi:Uncharacterised protein [Candidatus Burarchaeum australiense]|nr:Uncharacterised protein [Candidatus Burarchaeum australiense]
MEKQIGVAWERPHPGPFAWGMIEKKDGEFDFSQADRYVKAAQDNGVLLLGTIWPFADWDQAKCRQASACEVGPADTFYNSEIPNSRCKPCDMDKYSAFLRALAERYDGDGVDDMPGLVLPVRYWEVLNEPEMQSGELTFFKGTASDYLEVLKASSKAIKEACPECKIVQAGAAGTEQYMLDYWAGQLDAGAADYFDIANIHYINNGDLASLNVKPFKALFTERGISRPIWVTEAEYGEASTDAAVKSSTEGALSAGASKVFFTRFAVGIRGPPTPGKFSSVYLELADMGCNKEG